MNVRFARVLALCVAGTVGMHPGVGWARAPSPQEGATRSYEEGVRLFDDGEFEDAARAFEDAYALVPDPALLYNIGLAWDEAGQLEKALDALRRYADSISAEEAREVEGLLRSLENRIEKAEAERRRTRDKNDRKVFLRAAEDERSGISAEGEDEVSTPRGRADRSRADRKPRVFTPLAGAFLGVGVAGLATGLGLGIESQRHVGAMQDDCADLEAGLVCPASVQRDERRARGFAIGADTAFAVGGAALVGTIVVLAINGAKVKGASAKGKGAKGKGTNARGTKPQKGKSAWTPVAAPTQLGLRWTVQF